MKTTQYKNKIGYMYTIKENNALQHFISDKLLLQTKNSSVNSFLLHVLKKKSVKCIQKIIQGKFENNSIQIFLNDDNIIILQHIGCMRIEELLG